MLSMSLVPCGLVLIRAIVRTLPTAFSVLLQVFVKYFQFCPDLFPSPLLAELLHFSALIFVDVQR